MPSQQCLSVKEKHNPATTHKHFVKYAQKLPPPKKKKNGGKEAQSVTSMKVEFQRRDLSSTVVPSKPCRGHSSTTHLLPLSHDWKRRILKNKTD